MADLERFAQLFEGTEHLCGCGQEKVAKSVHCGEPRLDGPLETSPGGLSCLKRFVIAKYPRYESINTIYGAIIVLPRKGP